MGAVMLKKNPNSQLNAYKISKARGYLLKARTLLHELKMMGGEDLDSLGIIISTCEILQQKINLQE